jgi:chromate transporter
MVVAAAAAYVRFGGLSWVTAVFYGVSPVVIALILHSCYRLARLGMESWFQWAIVVAACAVTVVLEAEVALVFVVAGLAGLVFYGPLRGLKGMAALAMAAGPALAQSAASGGDVLVRLLLFFLKAGALTFGSGLVIVPFLEQGLVHQMGWLDQRQFLVAVAIGMISPGPVVITATFVGFLVAGWLGSVVATVGIFLPSFLLVLTIAPVLLRYRENPHVQGFVKGAYAAAIGTILGASYLLARVAIGDWLTVLIGLAGLVVLFRWKVSSYALVGAAAAIGLAAYPLLQPTWMLLK